MKNDSPNYHTQRHRALIVPYNGLQVLVGAGDQVQGRDRQTVMGRAPKQIFRAIFFFYNQVFKQVAQVRGLGICHSLYFLMPLYFYCTYQYMCVLIGEQQLLPRSYIQVVKPQYKKSHQVEDLQRRNTMKIFVLLASFLAVTQAHDWYSGECPVLTPLSEFSMERVSTPPFVQSNKSISRIFLTKFHFLQFQKWPKINF